MFRQSARARAFCQLSVRNVLSFSDQIKARVSLSILANFGTTGSSTQGVPVKRRRASKAMPSSCWKLVRASNRSMASAMASTPKRKVWIRGPGLNSKTQPTRALEFLGEGFENMKIEVTVDRMRPGGALYVILQDGYKLWVEPQFVTQPDTQGEEQHQGEGDPCEERGDLGSDWEKEDDDPEHHKEVGGSSIKHRRGSSAQEWTSCTILQDQRHKEGHHRVSQGQVKGIDAVERNHIWPYFWRFLPVQELDEGIAMMEQKGKSLWPGFTLNRDLFCKWMGLWFRMCGDQLKGQDDYWEAHMDEPYGETMSKNTFKRIKQVLSFPVYEDDAPEKVREMGDGPDRHQWIRKWLHKCNEAWKSAWDASTYPTIDETVVEWTGTGTAHLTYLPRKPKPLGVMLKVTCCGMSGVLLHAELVEGAKVDCKKEGYAEFKATTACSLRLVKAWWGTGRVVIGDAWFGSVRTVEELREVGLYAIMCVKQGSAGYPKGLMRESLRRRGDQRFFRADTIFNDGSILPVWAGGHMDKQPLMLCATTGTSLPGETKIRYRSKLVEGNVDKVRYELEQPAMHATYRKYAPAVDQFNKLSMQPGTLTDVWETMCEWHRLFAATLAMTESNAQRAYETTTGAHLTKQQWFNALAQACKHNPFALARPRTVAPSQGHTALVKAKQGVCWFKDCKKKTNWKCTCHRAFCGNTTRANKRPAGEMGAAPVKEPPRRCWSRHLSMVQAGHPDHVGAPTVRSGPRPEC